MKCLFHKTASSISTSWQSLLYQSTQSRIQLYWKKEKYTFSPYEKKVVKRRKKKISHEDRSWWDVWSFLFWWGEGRKRIEERKQKKQPQDNKLCVKQKIIPFEGHFLWVAASGRKETKIKHWRESPHLLMKHHSALKCFGSRESFLVLWWICRSQQTVWIKLCPLPQAHWPNMVRDRLITWDAGKTQECWASPGCWVQGLCHRVCPGGTRLLNRICPSSCPFCGWLPSLSRVWERSVPTQERIFRGKGACSH